MPLRISTGHPSLFFRKDAFERVGLTRSALDVRFGLTDAEFRAEGGLVCIGPIFETGLIEGFIGELEALGLVYFDDFFELSGNWPSWLSLFALAERTA